MSDLQLFHFRMSHFNEKARWALAYKGQPYVGHALLPGPHIRRIRKLSGQSQVPVLCDGEQVIAGSARIIEHLERRFPEPALYPRDPLQRRRALELQAWFDEEVGPAVRRARFSEIMRDPGFFTRQFTYDRGAGTRIVYRAIYPFVKRLMKKGLEINPTAVSRALEVTEEAFERVAKDAGATGHLVGDRFSVADLAAASLLMPAVDPPEGPRVPAADPPVLRQWLARWADHPGAHWVRAIYRRHRSQDQNSST